MLGVALKIFLIAGLVHLAVRTGKPLLSAFAYSIAHLLVLVALIYVFGLVLVDAPKAEIIAGLAVSFTAHFIVGYVIAWLLVRHEGKPWALALCTLLGIALLIL